ncbi:MAG: hypothetical protein ABH859_02620 [Pseudomonadota bacterium]
MPNFLTNIFSSLLQRDPHNETLRWIADYAHDLDLIDEIPEPESNFQIVSANELVRITGQASSINFRQNLLNSDQVQGALFDPQSFAQDLIQKQAFTRRITQLISATSSFSSEETRDRMSRYNRHWNRELARVQEQFPLARQAQERRALVTTAEDIEGRLEITSQILQQADEVNRALAGDNFSDAQRQQIRAELTFVVDQLLVRLENYGENDSDSEGLRAAQVADHLLRNLSLLVESLNHLAEFASLDANATTSLWQIFGQSRDLLHSEGEDVFERSEELRTQLFSAYSLLQTLGELENLSEQAYGNRWQVYVQETRANFEQAIAEQNQELLIQAQARFQRAQVYHEYQEVLANIAESLEQSPNSASTDDYCLAQTHLRRFCAQLLTSENIEESSDLEQAQQALQRAAQSEPGVVRAHAEQYLAVIEDNPELQTQVEELRNLLAQETISPRLPELITEIRPQVLAIRAGRLHEQWAQISANSSNIETDIIFLCLADASAIQGYSAEELDRLEQATLPLASAIIFAEAFQDERILGLARSSERPRIDEAFANLARVINSDQPESQVDGEFLESLSYLSERLPQLSRLAGTESFEQRLAGLGEAFSRASRSNQARWGRSVRSQFAFLSGRTTERLRNLANNSPDQNFSPLAVDPEDLLNPDYTENLSQCRTRDEVFELVSRVQAMARANQLPERLQDPRQQQEFLQAVSNHPAMQAIQAEVRVGQDAQELHQFALHLSLIAVTALASEVIAAAVVSEVCLGLQLLRLRQVSWLGRAINLGRFGQGLARVAGTTGRGRGVLIGQPVRRLMERTVMTPIFTASNLWLPGQIGLAPEFQFQGNWDVFVVRSVFTFGLFNAVGAAGQGYHRVANAFLRGARPTTSLGRFGLGAGWFGTETAVFTGYGLGELSADALIQGVPSDVIWNDLLTSEVIRDRSLHAVATLAGLRGAGIFTRPISHSFRARLGSGARNALMRNSTRTRDIVDELNELVRQSNQGQRLDQERYQTLRNEIVRLAQEQLNIYEQLHAVGNISDAHLGQVELATRRIEFAEQVRQLRARQLSQALTLAEETQLISAAQRLVEIEAQQHDMLQSFGADPAQVRAARDAHLLAQADLEVIRTESRLQRDWHEVEAELANLNQLFASTNRLSNSDQTRFLELTQRATDLAQEYRTFLENSGEQGRLEYVNRRAQQNLEAALEPQILFLRNAITASAQRVRDLYEQDQNLDSEITPDGVEVIGNTPRLREMVRLQDQVASQADRMEYLLRQADQRGLVSAEQLEEARNFLAGIRNRSSQLLNIAHAEPGSRQPAPPSPNNIHAPGILGRSENRANVVVHPDGRVSEETGSIPANPSEVRFTANERPSGLRAVITSCDYRGMSQEYLLSIVDQVESRLDPSVEGRGPILSSFDGWVSFRTVAYVDPTMPLYTGDIFDRLINYGDRALIMGAGEGRDVRLFCCMGAEREQFVLADINDQFLPKSFKRLIFDMHRDWPEDIGQFPFIFFPGSVLGLHHDEQFNVKDGSWGQLQTGEILELDYVAREAEGVYRLLNRAIEHLTEQGEIRLTVRALLLSDEEIGMENTDHILRRIMDENPGVTAGRDGYVIWVRNGSEPEALSEATLYDQLNSMVEILEISGSISLSGNIGIDQGIRRRVLQRLQIERPDLDIVCGLEGADDHIHIVRGASLPPDLQVIRNIEAGLSGQNLAAALRLINDVVVDFGSNSQTELRPDQQFRVMHRFAELVGERILYLTPEGIETDDPDLRSIDVYNIMRLIWIHARQAYTALVDQEAQITEQNIAQMARIHDVYMRALNYYRFEQRVNLEALPGGLDELISDILTAGLEAKAYYESVGLDEAAAEVEDFLRQVLIVEDRISPGIQNSQDRTTRLQLLTDLFRVIQKNIDPNLLNQESAVDIFSVLNLLNLSLAPEARVDVNLLGLDQEHLLPAIQRFVNALVDRCAELAQANDQSTLEALILRLEGFSSSGSSSPPASSNGSPLPSPASGPGLGGPSLSSLSGFSVFDPQPITQVVYDARGGSFLDPLGDRLPFFRLGESENPTPPGTRDFSTASLAVRTLAGNYQIILNAGAVEEAWNQLVEQASGLLLRGERGSGDLLRAILDHRYPPSSARNPEAWYFILDIDSVSAKNVLRIPGTGIGSFYLEATGHNYALPAYLREVVRVLQQRTNLAFFSSADEMRNNPFVEELFGPGIPTYSRNATYLPMVGLKDLRVPVFAERWRMPPSLAVEILRRVDRIFSANKNVLVEESPQLQEFLAALGLENLAEFPRDTARLPAVMVDDQPGVIHQIANVLPSQMSDFGLSYEELLREPTPERLQEFLQAQFHLVRILGELIRAQEIAQAEGSNVFDVLPAVHAEQSQRHDREIYASALAAMGVEIGEADVYHQLQDFLFTRGLARPADGTPYYTPWARIISRPFPGVNNLLRLTDPLAPNTISGTDGMGWLILAGIPEGRIAGDYCLYCTEIRIKARGRNILALAHLPLTGSNVGAFNDEFVEVLVALSDLGVNLSEARVHIVYGLGERTERNMPPGLEAAEVIASYGLQIATLGPILPEEIAQYDIANARLLWSLPPRYQQRLQLLDRIFELIHGYLENNNDDTRLCTSAQVLEEISNRLPGYLNAQISFPESSISGNLTDDVRQDLAILRGQRELLINYLPRSFLTDIISRLSAQPPSNFRISDLGTLQVQRILEIAEHLIQEQDPFLNLNVMQVFVSLNEHLLEPWQCPDDGQPAISHLTAFWRYLAQHQEELAQQVPGDVLTRSIRVLGSAGYDSGTPLPISVSSTPPPAVYPTPLPPADQSFGLPEYSPLGIILGHLGAREVPHEFAPGQALFAQADWPVTYVFGLTPETGLDQVRDNEHHIVGVDMLATPALESRADASMLYVDARFLSPADRVVVANPRDELIETAAAIAQSEVVIMGDPTVRSREFWIDYLRGMGFEISEQRENDIIRQFFPDRLPSHLRPTWVIRAIRSEANDPNEDTDPEIVLAPDELEVIVRQEDPNSLIGIPLVALRGNAEVAARVASTIPDQATVNSILAALAAFEFHPDFEVTFDYRTTVEGREGRVGEYYQRGFDGSFAFLIHHQGREVMVVSFNIGDNAIYVNQIQNTRRTGNNWMRSLPQPRREMVLSSLRNAFPGYDIYLVDGESLATRVRDEYHEYDDNLPKEVYDRIVSFYNTPLQGMQRDAGVTAADGFRYNRISFAQDTAPVQDLISRLEQTGVHFRYYPGGLVEPNLPIILVVGPRTPAEPTFLALAPNFTSYYHVLGVELDPESPTAENPPIGYNSDMIEMTIEDAEQRSYSMVLMDVRELPKGFAQIALAFNPSSDEVIESLIETVLPGGEVLFTIDDIITRGRAEWRQYLEQRGFTVYIDRSSQNSRIEELIRATGARSDRLEVVRYSVNDIIYAVRDRGNNSSSSLPPNESNSGNSGAGPVSGHGFSAAPTSIHMVPPLPLAEPSGVLAVVDLPAARPRPEQVIDVGGLLAVGNSYGADDVGDDAFVEPGTYLQMCARCLGSFLRYVRPNFAGARTRFPDNAQGRALFDSARRFIASMPLVGYTPSSELAQVGYEDPVVPMPIWGDPRDANYLSPGRPIEFNSLEIALTALGVKPLSTTAAASSFELMDESDRLYLLEQAGLEMFVDPDSTRYRYTVYDPDVLSPLLSIYSGNSVYPDQVGETLQRMWTQYPHYFYGYPQPMPRADQNIYMVQVGSQGLVGRRMIQSGRLTFSVEDPEMVADRLPDWAAAAALVDEMRGLPPSVESFARIPGYLEVRVRRQPNGEWEFTDAFQSLPANPGDE